MGEIEVAWFLPSIFLENYVAGQPREHALLKTILSNLLHVGGITAILAR